MSYHCHFIFVAITLFDFSYKSFLCCNISVYVFCCHCIVTFLLLDYFWHFHFSILIEAISLLEIFSCNFVVRFSLFHCSWLFQFVTFSLLKIYFFCFNFIVVFLVLKFHFSNSIVRFLLLELFDILYFELFLWNSREISIYWKKKIIWSAL